MGTTGWSRMSRWHRLHNVAFHCKPGVFSAGRFRGGKNRHFRRVDVFRRRGRRYFMERRADQRASRADAEDFMTVKEAIMATRKGWAVWKGGIKDGSGTISTETGVLHDAPYGFKSRFEKGEGTNPEELLAAAHAACFSMALSLFLGEAGLTPERIETHAAVTIDKVGEGFEITRSHLDVSAKI